jgi:peptidoglycan/xylan/chitin deacetylase (PgdA/CDA1 family)
VPVVVTVDVEFGDRPSDDPLRSLPRICDALDSHGAPATFFVQGRWAKAYPDHVAALAAGGGTIGLHGYSHVDYRRLTPDGVRGEIDDGLAALEAAAPGVDVRYTRLPHGYGADDPAICRVLEEVGLVPVGWDFSTFDWDDTLTYEHRLDRALGGVAHGGVVMFHSWPARTPDLVEGLLAAAGAAVVPLDDVELLGRQSNGRTIHRIRTDPPR